MMLSAIETIEMSVTLMGIGRAEWGQTHIAISNRPDSMGLLEPTFKQKLEDGG